MRPRGILVAWALASLSGCAAENAVRNEECCQVVSPPAPTSPPPPASAADEGYDPRDFAAVVYGPARCADAAARWLPTDANVAWLKLRGCVDRGQFTALRSLLSGAWDHELQTRGDAPELLARVIAMRGGDVDGDLRLLHERRVPLFSLSQALAQPQTYRGTLVIVRARLTGSGLVDEVRLASSVRDVELGPAQRLSMRQNEWSSDSTSVTLRKRAFNVDVPSGQRALVSTAQPFADPDDVLVLLARFDGLRDSDGWPTISVLAHHRPSALVSY